MRYVVRRSPPNARTKPYLVWDTVENRTEDEAWTEQDAVQRSAALNEKELTDKEKGDAD